MLNRILFQGRLVKDPEIVDVSGFKKANVTIAWSEKYKDTETKCFLKCEAWRGTAEFLEKYFSKGQEILIEGRMVTDEWEKDGQKQYRQYCSIEKVNFCGSKGAVSTNEDKPSNDFVSVAEDLPEELPFK